MRITLLLIALVAILSECTPDRAIPMTDTYYGYFPCADCHGIRYTLVLNADSTYQEKSFYEDRSTLPLLTEGRYAIDQDSIIVLQQPSSDQYQQLARNQWPKGIRFAAKQKRPPTFCKS